MNRKRNVFVSLLMALLLVFPVLLVSCSGSKKSVESDTVDTTGGTQAKEKKILNTSLPDTLDFDGAQIRFLVREAYKAQFFIEDAAMNIVDSAVVKRTLNTEQLLGVKLVFASMKAAYGDENTQYLQIVENDSLSSSAIYDVYDLYGYYGASLAIRGNYYNLQSIENMDLSREYWNASMVKETTYNNVMYMVSGPICLSETQNTVALVYNKDLLRNLHGDINIYSVVDNGNWTYEYMGTLLKDIYSDNGTTDIMDDLWGLGAYRISFACDAMLVSAGINMVERSENDIFRFTFQDTGTVGRFDYLYEFLHKYQSVYDPSYWNNGRSLTMFESGNMMFLCALFDNIATIAAGESSVVYGILPIPKYDAADEYATNVADYQSFLSIPYGIGQTHAEMIGAVLETMACISYSDVRPVYFEKMCKARYSATGDDSRMFDIINDSIVCNFGQVYSSAIGDPLWAARGRLWASENDYTGYIAGRIGTYGAKLEELILMLDKIS